MYAAADVTATLEINIGFICNRFFFVYILLASLLYYLMILFRSLLSHFFSIPSVIPFISLSPLDMHTVGTEEEPQRKSEHPSSGYCGGGELQQPSFLNIKTLL